ncbi:MAG: PAS domain S-box protein, partial [Proteobacteria bacterium]|nr:PAS domain S-box protein [Pseudomonadota bacterium]
MESARSFPKVRAFLTSDGKLLAVGLLLSLIILAFDLLTPLGVAGGVPYVVLVLLCLWAKHSACTYLMAFVGTVLTLVGLLLSPEGGVFWVVLTNRALAVLAIWAVALLSHKRLAEIDQRQLVETKRQSLEIRLGDVLDMSVDAIISVDRQGRIKFFSPGAENIFGYEPEEILGRPLEVLLPEAKREAHRAQRDSFARGTASRRPMSIRSELVAMRKDGSEFPAMASISKITTGGKELYTAILHDISDRKVAQEQLQHAQKLESVGRLTGGIAHEFNNLLMVIHGNLEMIENQLREHDPLRKLTSQAMAGAQRGAELTQGLLAFSRKQPLKSGNVDLNGLILRIQQVLQRPLGASITLKTDLEEKLWPVSTDVGQIEATLLNLVVNARDAMPRGGTITVCTSNLTVDGDVHYLRNFLSPGDYCVLEVIDTGEGMTASVKKQAFEP